VVVIFISLVQILVAETVGDLKEAVHRWIWSTRNYFTQLQHNKS